MDNQPPAENSKTKFAQIYDNMFATRRGKAILFLGTLVIAVIIALRYDLMTGHFRSGGDFGYFLFKFPSTIPAYLFVYLVRPVDFYGAAFVVFLSGVLGWAFYIIIMISGIGSKKMKTSKLLFLVFVLLLLINERRAVDLLRFTLFP